MEVYTSHTDEELTDLLKCGDKAAFTEIYNRYNGTLYIFALKRLRSRDEAMDLVHELFLTLWNNRESLIITTSLPAYLFSSVRNRIINIITHLKISKRYIDSFQNYLDKASVDTTDHLVRNNILSAFIETEIANLSPRMLQIFELSRKTNLTRKEIADELSISQETVKSQMHAALKILKARLGHHFYLLF